MREPSTSRSMLAVLRSLGWPLLWGMAGYAGLYVLIRKEVITEPTLLRYLESHPVSYLATAMFCVGIASLALMGLDVAQQWLRLPRIKLPLTESKTGSVAALPTVLQDMEAQPEALQQSLLWQRLMQALTWMERRGSAADLEEQLKYLADQEALQQQGKYALVRILIWATPMLGFLGTVIGISEALGGLQVGDGDFETMMTGLRESLYVAFDTTALALTLSIILMFLQFLVDRFESQLLTHVEARAEALLIGRFEEVGGGHDPVVKSLERLAKAMVQMSEQLVSRQADLWQESLRHAESTWQATQASTATAIREELTAALDQSLGKFVEGIGETQKQAEQAATKRWEQLQVAISDNARRMTDHQTEMNRQTALLEQTMTATGEVTRLEQALQRNLSAITEAGRFEETLTSLAATIHLLNARLTGASTAAGLDRKQQGKADQAA